MAALVPVSRNSRMTSGALRFADEGSRLGLHRVGLPIRTRLDQDGLFGGDSFLEVATREEPASFGIAFLSVQPTQLFAGRYGLARLEQGASQLLTKEVRGDHRLPLSGAAHGQLEGSGGARRVR